MLALKKHFPRLVAAGFDNWQSASFIAELGQAGVLAEDYPFTRQQQFDLYSQTKSLVYNNLLECVPTPKLQRELEQLQLVNARKIDHRSDQSKDLSDALVIAVNLALQQANHSQARIYF